jgi:hypothetical protein
MKHLKLFEDLFIEGESIKIYHGTYREDDAKSIVKNGWDESRRYRASAEGDGMGAFFSPDDMIYGDWTIEFDVSISDFKNWIVFDTNPDVGKDKKLPYEVMNLAKRVNGRVDTVEDQILRINGNGSLVPRVEMWFEQDIGRIKGWVTQWRFGYYLMSIHLRDPSIAKPVRYFPK